MELKPGDKIKDNLGFTSTVAATGEGWSVMLFDPRHDLPLLEYITASRWYTLVESEVKP
jgi:hypothetical protein